MGLLKNISLKVIVATGTYVLSNICIKGVDKICECAKSKIERNKKIKKFKEDNIVSYRKEYERQQREAV